MAKRKRLKYEEIKQGDIFKVIFDAPYFTYAHELTDAAMAFYDLKTDIEIESLNKIIELPILFILKGGADKVLTGEWERLGNIELEDKLKKNPLFYTKENYRETDDGAILSYYRINDNGVYRQGTEEEVENLEYGFIWNSSEIEERIKNHYNGIKFVLDPYYKILPK
jgi:hypothetical protein